MGDSRQEMRFVSSSFSYLDVERKQYTQHDRLSQMLCAWPDLRLGRWPQDFSVWKVQILAKRRSATALCLHSCCFLGTRVSFLNDAHTYIYDACMHAYIHNIRLHYIPSHYITSHYITLHTILLSPFLYEFAGLFPFARHWFVWLICVAPAFVWWERFVCCFRWYNLFEVLRQLQKPCCNLARHFSWFLERGEDILCSTPIDSFF